MILVTGGAGYVGSHFLHEYIRLKQAECIVVDNLSEGRTEALPHSNCRFVNCSIGDTEQMEKLFEQNPIDAVVHFAASAYVGQSQEHPFEYFENNVVQSLRLFEVMERHGVRKLVFSSTCATYGTPEYVPIDEKHVQKPVNVYGNTKLIVEKILHSLGETKNWSYVALRYFNAAGAAEDGSIGEGHEPETHLIPLVLKAAKLEIPYVSILGDDYDTADGSCVRDYIHVNDLAAAHSQALDLLQSQRATECINLGTERGASVKEIIDLSRQVTASDIQSRVVPRRSGDPAVLVANAAKAKAVLGWEPKYELRKIIESAWKWEQNRLF